MVEALELDAAGNNEKSPGVSSSNKTSTLFHFHINGRVVEERNSPSID
jgi:hypothetical protein